MAGSVAPKEIIVFADGKGREPFSDWLKNLRDMQGRQRIFSRLRRLEQGNYGDCRALQDGVYELRLFFGPGYRVYFGEDGGNIVVLLCGGDKDSQEQDIKATKAFWKEYRNREKIPDA